MTTPVRVLLVEDQETDAKLVLQALRRIERPIEHQRVEDAPAMRKALAEQHWDLVLSDWSLPRFSALAALEVMKESKLDLPFIIVSGTVGEETAADAMRAGARDYVLKDKLARLTPAVERELREAEGRVAQRLAERALRAQEARFRALVENSHEGIVLSARDGTTIYMSATARRFIGAVEGTTPSAVDFIHPDDRARVSAFRNGLLQRPNESAAIEVRALLADGTTRWLEVTGTNLLDDPTVQAIVGNFHDVTDRKQALDALRVSEVRFGRLADSGLIGVAVAEISGRIIEANDAWLKMTGYDGAEVAAGEVAWTALTTLEQREHDEAALAQLQTCGVASPWETVLQRKDGTHMPALIGVAMLDHPQSISFVVDLTDRKRAEAALRASEEQLRHAQKMDAVGRLAGGISHDFNNILSVILSYSHLLLGDLREGDPMREDLEEIKKAGTRAASLTQQLLLFSRQQILDPKVLDLNDLLAHMDKMLHRLVGEDVELCLSAAPALGRVKIDPGHVEQVVMNLVVNARDAMPKGGRLTIETANVDLDEAFARNHLGVNAGPHVMLEVTDTGSGIDKATQARIFEPFFTTKGAGKGTGLGLSTVFGIVQQSGGSIWVYSELGKGSSFKVYLPRVAEEPEVQVIRSAPALMSGGETILVVEDEEQVRVVARGILRKNGYRVIESKDVASALLLGRSHEGHIHLLLTDVVMPQMSGPELAAKLATSRPDMRVLFMSGYTDDSVARHGLLQSHQAFIQKPFTPESLTTKIREVLERVQ